MQLISVTQALSPYFKQLEKIRPDILENAAARGTEVHVKCALIAQNLYPCYEVSGIEGYVISFRLWFESQVTEVLAVERRFEHAAFGFFGHPDLVVKMKEGHTALIDLKTPATLSKLWRSQISAYKFLVREQYPDVKSIGSLRLNPDGKTPKMDWYETDHKDFAVFLSALNAYRNLLL